MQNLVKLVQDVATPVGRVLMSLIFIISGWGKIAGYSGTAGYMEAMGVPSFLLPLVIALELGGGILLLIGFQTRLVAFLLGGFTLFAGLLFHYAAAQAGTDPAAIGNDMIHFWKNVAIAGGMGVLVGNGAGKFSLDAARAKA